MTDQLNELERQVEGGNLFAHSTLTEHASRINEAAAIVNGLVGLLVQRGLIEGDELLAAVDSVRERTEQAGHHAHVGIAVRVEQEVEEPEIDCEARLPICKAACCRLHFALSVEEVERGGPLRWELGHPYFNRHNADGYCHQWDDGCGIYDERPSVCRSYTCADDDRIWKDFDAMELNHEFIDSKLSGERGPIELFMDAHRRA
ncbi:YkgJ family cysteine cluster protein [Solirubrobacter taibaiensis]|nr:YkgJ family cysteine cluster protein [Solirubrobacter taibaiensis]